MAKRQKWFFLFFKSIFQFNNARLDTHRFDQKNNYNYISHLILEHPAGIVGHPAGILVNSVCIMGNPCIMGHPVKCLSEYTKPVRKHL